MAIEPLPTPTYRAQEKLHPGITARRQAELEAIKRRLAEQRSAQRNPSSP